jgi:hypothetical protein
MNGAVRYVCSAAIAALMAAAASGCASNQRQATTCKSEPGNDTAVHNLRAGAEADAAYYHEQAKALAAGSVDAIIGTDFGRFRRGALYAVGAVDSDTVKSLQRKLKSAMEKDDFTAALDITRKILDVDEADIGAHMMYAIALEKFKRAPEARYHFKVAGYMLRSLAKTGDGRDWKTAWKVYRVKEEYDLMRFMGFDVQTQALAPLGDHVFDVLDVRDAGNANAYRVYFDITELFAEEQRTLQPPASSAPKAGTESRL